MIRSKTFGPVRTVALTAGLIVGVGFGLTGCGEGRTDEDREAMEAFQPTIQKDAPGAAISQPAGSSDAPDGADAPEPPKRD
ncbi:MAG: hypothetical protein AB8G96_13805 [Phycisphaerales bacterium]